MIWSISYEKASLSILFFFSKLTIKGLSTSSTPTFKQALKAEAESLHQQDASIMKLSMLKQKLRMKSKSDQVQINTDHKENNTSSDYDKLFQ